MQATLEGRPAPSGGVFLPALDALRGVAILAVFTQHLGDRFLPLLERSIASAVPAPLAPWALTILHHAHWGVDLFFVLSGFSLAQGYLRAFAQRREPTSARTFLIRRAARILPAYYVAIVVTLAVHRRLFADHELAHVGWSLAAHAVALQGYVAPFGIILIGASWSLTTEIGFYLLMPLLARPLLGRSSRAWLFGAALVVLAWASRSWLHDRALEPTLSASLLEATQRRWISSRLDQFVLGAMAARLHALPVTSPRRAWLGLPLLAAATVVLVIGFRLEGELYLEPGGAWPYAILSLATAAIVLAATSIEGRALAILAPAWLRRIGVVSYGMFLYHQLALGLVGWAIPGEGHAALALNVIGALAASIGVGALSWVIVERPALGWARRLETGETRETAETRETRAYQLP